MNPPQRAPYKKPNSMTTLQKLIISLTVVITMETLYANSSAFGEHKLKILHNGAGSLTVKIDDRWGRNHQPYDGRGTMIANGEKGDAGICVVGVNPLDRGRIGRHPVPSRLRPMLTARSTPCSPLGDRLRQPLMPKLSTISACTVTWIRTVIHKAGYIHRNPRNPCRP